MDFSPRIVVWRNENFIKMCTQKEVYEGVSMVLKSQKRGDFAFSACITTKFINNQD